MTRVTPSHTEAVKIPAGAVTLDGDLSVPAGARGIVLFAHGSGSSRHSSRNRYVAEALQQSGMATLLMDLLTSGEEVIDNRTRELRFDIELLAGRVSHAIDWLTKNSATRALRIGLFGASTGAAAALAAAASKPPEAVAAVVSRGGRPDLAGDALGRVRAPTLLVVGGDDIPVIAMNKDAMAQMTMALKVHLNIVPGATHLFEEPGTLDEVVRLTTSWLHRYLTNEHP